MCGRPLDLQQASRMSLPSQLQSLFFYIQRKKSERKKRRVTFQLSVVVDSSGGYGIVVDALESE